MQGGENQFPPLQDPSESTCFAKMLYLLEISSLAELLGRMRSLR